MTIQTKHFIELSDILTIRIECNNKECGTVVCLPLSKEIRLTTIRICPNCGQPWLTIPSSSIEPTIQKCIDSIKGTVAAIHGWEQQMKAASLHGFSLALEIKADAAPGSEQKKIVAS